MATIPSLDDLDPQADEELRTANARLRALIDVGLELSSELDADRLFQRMGVAARDLFAATYVTVGIVNPDDGTMQCLLTCGADPAASAHAAGWIDSGAAVPGLFRPVIAERRRCAAGILAATRPVCSCRQNIRKSRPTSPRRSPPSRPSTVGFVSSGTRAGPSPGMMRGWSGAVGTGRTRYSGSRWRQQPGRGPTRSSSKFSTASGRRRPRATRRCAPPKSACGSRSRAPASASGTWTTPPACCDGPRSSRSQYGLQPGTFGGTFEAFIERIHPDDRAAVLETIAKATKSGADFSLQHRSIWPDGTVRWLSGAGRVHLGAHGEPVRGVGISQDITERRTLEEQYQQAQKMEAVGRLAGGVAHDFNNLLTVILGYCELLLADLDPDDPRQAEIAEIQKAGARAAGLTRQLLAFSRKQIIEPTRARPERRRGRHAGDARRLIGEDVKVVLSLAAGAGAGEGRSRPDRADRHEPGGERARRHAERRHADDRDRQRRARRALREDAPAR